MLLNGIRHQLTNVIVYPNHDETATAIAYLNVLKFANTSTLSKTDNPALLAHAVQVVQFRKENDVWKLAHLTIDQMAVSDIFGLDKATRDYFAALAGEREQLGQTLF